MILKKTEKMALKSAKMPRIFYELFHAYSLLNSAINVSVPSLFDFTIYLFSPFSGVPSTINSANYVMFICLERVLDLGHPDAVKVFCEQMLELHRGQAQ